MAIKVNHNPAGKDLALHFNVITNVLDGQDQFKAELIVTNQSAYTLEGNWSIYFNFLRMILPESVSKGFQMRHYLGYKYFFLWVLVATIPSFLAAWFVPFKKEEPELANP